MSNLTNKLLQAMDIIVDQKLANYDRDITVEAEVISKEPTGKYTVKYNSTIYSKVSANGSYLDGDMVLMLVPQGDFSKEKTILSKIGQSESDEAYAYADLDDIYDLVGQNLIIAGENNTYSGAQTLWNNVPGTSNELTLATNNEAKASLLFDIYLQKYHKFKFSAECSYSVGEDYYLDADYGIRFTFSNNKSVELNINDISGNPYDSGSNFIFQSKFFIFTKEEAEALGNLTDIKLFATTGVNFSIKNLTIYGVADPSDSPYDLVFRTPNGVDASSNPSPVIEAYVRNDGNKVEDISNIDFKWFIQDKGAPSGWRKVQDSTVDNFEGNKDKLTLSSDLVWLTKSVLKCQVTQNGVVFDKELDITHSGRPEKYITALTNSSAEDAESITLTATLAIETPQDYKITVAAFNSAKNKMLIKDKSYESNYISSSTLTELIKYPNESIEYRCTLKTSNDIYLDSASIIIGAEIHYPTAITTYYLCTSIDQLSKLPDWPDGQFTINKAKWKTGSEIEGFNAINKYLWTCEEVTFDNDKTITTMPALLTVWEDEYLDTTFTLTKYYQAVDSIIDAPEIPATDENGVISEGGFGNWSTELPNNNYVWGFDYLHNSTLNKAFSTMPECFYYVADQDDAPSYETITMYCGLPQVTDDYLDFNKLPSPRPDNKLQIEEGTISETSIVGIKPIDIDNIFGQWDVYGENCSCSINNKEITITQGAFISGQQESYLYSPQFAVKKDTRYIFEADIKFDIESTEEIIKEGEIYITLASHSDSWISKSFRTNSHLQLKCTPSIDKIKLRFDANTANTTYTVSNIRMYEEIKGQEEYTLPSTYEAFSTKEFNGLTHKWFWSSDIEDIKKTHSKFIYSTSQNVFNGVISPEGWSECRVHAIYTGSGDNYNYNVDSWNLYLLGNPDGEEGVFYPRDEEGKERVVINASLIQAGELRVRKGENDILYARMDQDEEGNEDPKVTIGGWEVTEDSFYAKTEENQNEISLYSSKATASFKDEKLRIKIGKPTDKNDEEQVMVEDLSLLLVKDDLTAPLSEQDNQKLQQLNKSSDISYIIDSVGINNYSAEYRNTSTKVTSTSLIAWGHAILDCWSDSTFTISPQQSKTFSNNDAIVPIAMRAGEPYDLCISYKSRAAGLPEEYTSFSYEYADNNNNYFDVSGNTGSKTISFGDISVNLTITTGEHVFSWKAIVSTKKWSIYNMSDLKIEIVRKETYIDNFKGKFTPFQSSSIPYNVIECINIQPVEDCYFTTHYAAFKAQFDLSNIKNFTVESINASSCEIKKNNYIIWGSIDRRNDWESSYEGGKTFSSQLIFDITLKTCYNAQTLLLSELKPFFNAFEIYQISAASVVNIDGNNVVLQFNNSTKQIMLANSSLTQGSQVLLRFSSLSNTWEIISSGDIMATPVEISNPNFTQPQINYLIQTSGIIVITGSFYSRPYAFMVTESGKFYAFDGTLYGPISTTGITLNYRSNQLKLVNNKLLIPLNTIKIGLIQYYIYCEQSLNSQNSGPDNGKAIIGIVSAVVWDSYTNFAT